MWNRFIKVENGIVTASILSKQDEVDGFIKVEEPVRVDSTYDEATGTFTLPNPDERRIIKALVLIIKAAIQEGVIPVGIVPQEAKDIWQEIKDNRL